jgi:EH domain-containing protein 1
MAGAGCHARLLETFLALLCCPQVRPLEDAFKFGSFFSPLLHESDFEAKPSVLLLGQYSTGEQ